MTHATCREEILDAVAEVLRRGGAATFTVADVVAEMNRRGTSYAESTIRTHIVSRMCANAPDHHGTVYADLERVGHGIYRIRR